MRKDNPAPHCGYIRDECFNGYAPPARERKKNTPAAPDGCKKTAAKSNDTAAMLLALFAYLANG